MKQKEVFSQVVRLLNMDRGAIIKIETETDVFKARIGRVTNSVNTGNNRIFNFTVTAELQSVTAESQLHENIHLEASTDKRYVLCFTRTKHEETTHPHFTQKGASLFDVEYGDNIQHNGVVQSIALTTGS